MLCFSAHCAKLAANTYNANKDPQCFAVQVSDTTMLPKAVFLPGQ